MAKNDFVPKKENDLLVMHDKFVTGTAAHGLALTLTAGDLTAIGTDNEDLHADITASVNADAAAKSATTTKQATIRRVVASLRAYARRMKAAPGYTEALGEDMGIEGPEDTTDLSTSKPTLTGKSQGGSLAEIAFNKSISEGINLYSQREGEAVFTFLARDTESPYIDTRPLLVAGKPERREYRARYILADAEIGDFSDEMVITVTP